MPARPALVTPPVTAPSSVSVSALVAQVAAWLAIALTQYKGPGAATALRAMLLASISPRPANVLLTGAPGTAKTAMGNAVAVALGGSFMGRTLSPWTGDAEILGPVDLAALAANRLERAKTPGRPSLLDADTVLLDEFPRASPGIRAMVMSALADRITPTGDPVPAHLIIAGANTRLTSEEDAAIVDRFVLRVDVPRLMSATDLRAVMFREVPVGGAAPTIAPLPALPAGTATVLRAHAATVDFPVEVADAMVAFALALRQPSPTGASFPDVSERRWIVATRILQASATLRGATSVDWSDLTSTLPLTYDDGPESRPALAAALAASIPRWVRALDDLDAACLAAAERARRVGAASAAPGIDAMRDGDGDAHARLDDELDAMLAPLKSYGAEIAKRGDERAERCRDESADAYAEGVSAARTARKAAR